MKRKSIALMAFVMFGAGYLVALGVRVVSLPATQHEAVPDEYGQILRQTHARLDRVEQTLTTLAGAVGDAIQASARLEEHSARSAEPVRSTPQALPSEQALRQEIAQILREELWNVLAAAGAGADGVQAEDMAAAKVLDTPQNVEAYTRAHEVVRGALASRYWADDDAQELRQSFASLTNAQREEILQILFPAINRGEIAVETSGSPL